MFEKLIASAFFPAILDIGKSIIAKIFKLKAEPQTIDDRIKLMEAQAKYFEAISEFEKPSEYISKWINDLRASIRYLLAGFIFILSAFYFIFGKNVDIINALMNMDAIIFGFFFGDRVYYNLKKGK